VGTGEFAGRFVCEKFEQEPDLQESSAGRKLQRPQNAPALIFATLEVERVLLRVG
jgi:hypothetical protein